MKILAFLVAFLFCVAFVLAFIGSRADDLSVKEAFSKLSSTIAVVALLIGAYGGASVTLSSVDSASEGKFKAVTNNEVRYFNKKLEQESPDLSQERNALFLFLYQLLSVLVPDVLFYNLFAHIPQSTHVVTVAP